MNQSGKPQPTIAQIEDWLANRHDHVIEDLCAIEGGFWSSAFAYSVDGTELVLRISDMREGFTIDAAAMRFAAPNLPVPVVVEVSSGFGGYYAISRRHYGRFIETSPASDAQGIGTALGSLLKEMRSVPTTPSDPILWYDADASGDLTWRRWLLSGLIDDPTARVSGWRVELANNPHLDGLFRKCESRIRDLLPVCPERRDLVHGDLLYQNVLISEDDASLVTAVFSWKCSVLGDFLYDVAWCTFWGDWHPAIADADIWHRTLVASDLREGDLKDAPLRHHCYELQIAATHLAWQVWTGDDDQLATVARAAEATLDRGPLGL